MGEIMMNDIKTIIIVILLMALVLITTILYVWLIAFRNLCESYCSVAGYQGYKIREFTCTCITPQIGRI